MNTFVKVLSLLVLVAATGAVQAGPIGTYDSYGIWFDRDGVDASQAASWGAVNGGTYNTGGIYDVVIDYHALSATSATMFATINGIQQGFWDNGYATPAPNIYPAGLSFTGDMTNMLVFDWLIGWGSKSGTAVFENITASGTRFSGSTTPRNYGNVTIDSILNPAPFVNVFATPRWDLTQGDLALSYTADLSGVTGPDDNSAFVAQIGLRTPLGYPGLVGRGMMGNVVDNSSANDGSLNYNDKFDLQRLGSTDELAYDVTVPEPATLALLGLGLAGLGLSRRKQ